MPLLQKLLGPLLGLLGAVPATALEWQSTMLEARAQPFQKTLVLTFAFKNSSAKPVAVLDLQTDCSCISANADKKNYAPGETGRITAQFSLDERSGLYERHLRVLTDESLPAQQLDARIDVPELASLKPRSLEWRLNEAAGEKIVELRAEESLRITFTQATPTNASFAARLEPVVPDQVYKLVVTPRNTTAVSNAAIRITGHDSGGHEILVSAYANVR